MTLAQAWHNPSQGSVDLLCRCLCDGLQSCIAGMVNRMLCMGGRAWQEECYSRAARSMRSASACLHDLHRHQEVVQQAPQGRSNATAYVMGVERLVSAQPLSVQNMTHTGILFQVWSLPGCCQHSCRVVTTVMSSLCLWGSG